MNKIGIRIKIDTDFFLPEYPLEVGFQGVLNSIMYENGQLKLILRCILSYEGYHSPHNLILSLLLKNIGESVY